MRRTQPDLVAILLVSVLLAVIISFLPSNVLRVIVGVPFIIFFPGYTLIAALFPRKEDLGGVERIALSFGLSIAIVPLIGLILNYTPWGIKLYPILGSTTAFIFLAAGIAWLRRWRLPVEDRFSVELKVSLPQWRRLTGWDRVLSGFLALSVVGAIGAISYMAVTPRSGERFTEFYVLGLGGKAADYPTEVMVGQRAEVILGIVNHEHQDAVYNVRIVINGQNDDEVGPIELSHEEKWEDRVAFTPQTVGDRERVEFFLDMQGMDEPYRQLYLLVDVKGAS